MHNCHCKNWAVTTLYFRRVPYIITNEWQYYLVKWKNKNCQNKKRLPHSFYILKLKCDSTFLLFTFFMLQVCWNIFNIDLYTLVIKYTIILNINFSHTILSSVAHNATLVSGMNIRIIYVVQIHKSVHLNRKRKERWIIELWSKTVNYGNVF